MQYEKGDRVFLIPNLEDGKTYGLIKCDFAKRIKYTDRLVTIREVLPNYYIVSHPLFVDCLLVTDEMIAGYGFEYGEKCLMWDDQETCAAEQIFTTYDYGDEYPYRTIRCRRSNGIRNYGYKYAKSLPKQPKTVTITLTEAQLEEVKKIIKI